MSGNGSEPNLEHVKTCNEGEDRISQLQDDILVSILSSLPLKESAATSLVAPRWSQLWRYTTNLVFRNSRCRDPEINIPVTVPQEGKNVSSLRRSLKNIAWVNSVVDLHKALSLKQFTLDFYLHDFQSLPKWLSFVLSRRVQTLELDFHFAESIIDLNILSTLKSSDYRFLKELNLRFLKVSGEAIGLFVRNCSSLERLVLKKVTLTSDLVIAGGSALNYLELYSRGEDEILTRVSALSLTRLRCSYDLNTLFLEDVPNLVDASFYLFGDSSGSDTMDRVANAASNLEILTITLMFTKVFSTPQMPKLSKLVLDYFSVSKGFMLPVTDLLWASPCLQEFRLKVTDDARFYHSFTGHERIFEVPKLGNQSPHHHLNVFEFSGFYCVAADHMELLGYVVDSCVALREIIISPLFHGRYSEFLDESTIEYPESNTYNIVSSPNEVEEDLHDKELTGRMLAAARKVPPHINLIINGSFKG